MCDFKQRVAPARPDLVERFRDYILDLWRQARDQPAGRAPPRHRLRPAGPAGATLLLRLLAPDDRVFQWGDPPRYDMRYTYPARYLQLRMDGEIDWDELHFTGEVAVHQVTYAQDFYIMLRSEMLDLG